MVSIYVFKPEFSEEHIEGHRLEPEVMAAVLARFSRTGDGMKKILADLADLDFSDSKKMVDRILRFIDYGHQSIGGLTGGVPIGVDGVSMLTPYMTFFNQPKQDGQETSTRYCEYKPEGLAHPSAFNVPERFHKEWYPIMLEGFNISSLVCAELDRQVTENPTLARIPKDATPKEADRMKRNYGFDRARYTLPVAALTNFGVIMTGREWTDTLKLLSASTIPEMIDLASEIRPPLDKMLPHLMKHSFPTDMATEYMKNFFGRGAEYIRHNGVNTDELPDAVVTNVQLPEENGLIERMNNFSLEDRFDNAFKGKKNRYDIARGYPEKVHVSTYWNNMSIAEARDINRQRPCQKDTLLAPVGFYMAPEMKDAIDKLGLRGRYISLQEKRAELLENLANSTSPESYASALFLGDQTQFELHTNASHMTYVIELRTGRGVHFRYDDHVRQAFESFEKQLPEWTKHIQLGTGEPE